jgi:hypothetical protein
MIQIRFTGWQPGLQKVKLDKLLRDRVPMRLADAKRIVDRLLDGQEVYVQVESETAASEIVASARSAGAICERVDSVAATTSKH